VGSATEDVFEMLEQARGTALSVAQLAERLGGRLDEDEVHVALEHLRDEGVAVEDTEGHWALR
jgi:biotin operon repressor